MSEPIPTVDPVAQLENEIAAVVVTKHNERIRSSIQAVRDAYDGEPVEWIVEQLRNAITEAVGVTPDEATLHSVVATIEAPAPD